MKRLTILSALAALFIVAAGLPAGAGPGLVNSSHDLRTLQNLGQTNNQVCIYCHTPHRAADQNLIWNHSLGSGNYSFGATGPFGSPGRATTAAGTTLPASTTAFGSGPTKMCMSCHDGSVALGALNNIGDGTPGIIPTTPATLSGETHQIASASGGMGGNHPVAIPYPDRAGAVYNGITTGVTSGFGGAAGSGGWADVTSAQSAGVKLHGGSAAGTFGMECTSCHEPHNDGVATTEGEAGKYFLRVSGDNSALCLACHRK
ncbi:MAG: hypothetical protein HZC42_07085 [Candidatus Eisenbacteria bacterium]|nr:hypothetical protein [Candidatus Eisenbacteria bacterium]